MGIRLEKGLVIASKIQWVKTKNKLRRLLPKRKRLLQQKKHHPKKEGVLLVLEDPNLKLQKLINPRGEGVVPKKEAADVDVLRKRRNNVTTVLVFMMGAKVGVCHEQRL